MNGNLRSRAAQQGIGIIAASVSCTNCNYIAETNEEKDILLRVNAPCPKCGTSGQTRGMAPSRYIDVANWIGEYAATKIRRDHVSAVIMFCALTESILETLKDKYISIHPEIKLKPKKYLLFKDIFGSTLCDLLNNAPGILKNFTLEWDKFREKRNKFLHGKSSSYHITESDAHEAMDLALVAIQVYVWLNNKYCLKI